MTVTGPRSASQGGQGLLEVSLMAWDYELLDDELYSLIYF